MRINAWGDRFLKWGAVWGAPLVLTLCPSLSVQAASGEMPLVRLRLYETGVGYFERRGPLQSGAQLPVPATHLDDALNSLVIWDPEGKTQIDGLSFSSVITADKRRALAGLPAHDLGELGFDHILEGLRGVHLELGARGRLYQGRMLARLRGENSGLRICSQPVPEENGRDPKSIDHDCVRADEDVLTLVSEKSEILRFPTRDITSLRPLEPEHAGRLSMAAERSTAAEGTLRIQGNATGPVTLGYVAETPLWRTSYRVLLPESLQSKGLLQAWALIHNDTEELWRQVRIDLVSGQPDSFLFPFAAPRYHHRRLVTPEQELASVRQLERTGADDRWDGGDDSMSERSFEGTHGMGLAGFGLIGHGAGGSGRGQKMKIGSSLLSIGDIASLDVAEGKALGALFHYALPRAIDLAPHHSALLPLLSEDVEMRRVTVFEYSQQSDRPSQGRSVLVLTNQTRQTLPAGIMSIFHEGAFIGETALPRLNAGQTGHVAFGLDLDIAVSEVSRRETDASRLFRTEPRVRSEAHRQSEQPVHSERQDQFIIERHYMRSTQLEFLIANRSSEQREVRLSFPTVQNARLTGADSVSALAEEGRVLASFQLDAGASRNVTLTKEEGLVDRKVDPSAHELRTWASSPHLDATQKSRLDQVASALEAVAAAKSRRASLSASIQRELANLSSMRASLAALRGVDAKKGKALAGDLLQAEARLAKLRKELGGVRLLAEQHLLETAWLKFND